jgi:pimeloyl-ACP methyl ester carboxylesterase
MMIRQIDGEAIQISSWQREPGPDVPAVLWLHGAGMDRTVWTLAARDPGLRDFASLAVDLPGHGRSAGCARGSIADYACFVASLLDVLGLAQVALVGHSMGALIVLEMLARCPERLRALVLAGAAARMPVNPALLQAAADDLPKAARMIATFAVAPAGRRAARETPGVRLGGTGVALLENSRPGVLAADLQACDRAKPPVRPAAMPCLVVSGGKDRMTPAGRGAELALALGACSVRIEEAGHMAMLEQPQAFAGTVVPFLRDDQASARAR